MEGSYTELGFAKPDLSRKQRTGFSETVFCQYKTPEQVTAIFAALAQTGTAVLGTRCLPEHFKHAQEQGLAVQYDPTSRTMTLGSISAHALPGSIAVCSAGTADLPVAEEAARVAEFFGATVHRFYDVGVAGLHRLLSKIEQIRQADIVIAVAGMEGALAGVLAGLLKSPVIAVPTSVGYGASFQGMAALLAMLNSCAEGVSVVNIDNGFVAAGRRVKYCISNNHKYLWETLFI